MVNPHSDKEKAITRAIEYLHQHQFPNGEFCAYMSGDDPMQGWVLPISIIFPTALISQSLQFVKNHEGEFVESILKKAESFLWYQVGTGATWNHFTRLHPLCGVCPQDLDDTVCVSLFLRSQMDGFQDSVNRQLILDNRNSEGLIYTWFTFRWKFNHNPLYWRISLAELKHPIKSFFFWRQTEANRYDIDAVVNANALLYLGSIPETQPIINYLIKIISEEREGDCDVWYRNPFSVYYFFTRPYYEGISELEPIRQPIIDRIRSKMDSSGRIGESHLDTAFSACALMNLHYEGSELHAAVEYLISRQKPTGEWERRLVYYGGPKKLAGYGGEELVTGFCLEALARYHETSLKKEG